MFWLNIAAIDLTRRNIHVIRLSNPHADQIALSAEKYRQLRLQSLRNSHESFTETYETAAALPNQYWQDVLVQK